MTEINFKGKGLNQKIFSKKAVRATVGRKSSAFRAIMENKKIAKVVDKMAEKRVLYDALKKRGQAADGRGITKNVLKKVLGDIEHSGQFSHKEMHVLGEELIGGAASSRIIRDHSSAGHSEMEKESHRSVDMRRTYDEIIKKDRTKRFNSASEGENHGEMKEKNNSFPHEFSSRLAFVQSNDVVRQAQDKNVVADFRGASGNGDSRASEHASRHLKGVNDDADNDKIKSILARIQEDDRNEESE